jgi:hypothetical protein
MEPEKLMKMDKKPALAIMLAGGKPEEDDEREEGEMDGEEPTTYDEADEATATELMDALKGDDPGAVLKAFSALMKVCG